MDGEQTLGQSTGANDEAAIRARLKAKLEAANATTTGGATNGESSTGANDEAAIRARLKAKLEAAKATVAPTEPAALVEPPPSGSPWPIDTIQPPTALTPIDDLGSSQTTAATGEPPAGPATVTTLPSPYPFGSAEEPRRVPASPAALQDGRTDPLPSTSASNEGQTKESKESSEGEIREAFQKLPIIAIPNEDRFTIGQRLPSTGIAELFDNQVRKVPEGRIPLDSIKSTNSSVLPTEIGDIGFSRDHGLIVSNITEDDSHIVAIQSVTIKNQTFNVIGINVSFIGIDEGKRSKRIRIVLLPQKQTSSQTGIEIELDSLVQQIDNGTASININHPTPDADPGEGDPDPYLAQQEAMIEFFSDAERSPIPDPEKKEHRIRNRITGYMQTMHKEFPNWTPDQISNFLLNYIAWKATTSQPTFSDTSILDGFYPDSYKDNHKKMRATLYAYFQDSEEILDILGTLNKRELYQELKPFEFAYNMVDDLLEQESVSDKFLTQIKRQPGQGEEPIMIDDPELISELLDPLRNLSLNYPLSLHTPGRTGITINSQVVIHPDLGLIWINKEDGSEKQQLIPIGHTVHRADEPDKSYRCTTITLQDTSFTELSSFRHTERQTAFIEFTHEDPSQSFTMELPDFIREFREKNWVSDRNFGEELAIDIPVGNPSEADGVTENIDQVVQRIKATTLTIQNYNDIMGELAGIQNSRSSGTPLEQTKLDREQQLQQQINASAFDSSNPEKLIQVLQKLDLPLTKLEEEIKKMEEDAFGASTIRVTFARHPNGTLDYRTFHTQFGKSPLPLPELPAGAAVGSGQRAPELTQSDEQLRTTRELSQRILTSRDFTGLYEDPTAWERTLQNIVNDAELKFITDIAGQHHLESNQTRQMFLELMEFVQDGSSTQSHEDDTTLPLKMRLQRYLKDLPIKPEAQRQIRDIITNFAKEHFTSENYVQNAQAAADFLIQFYPKELPKRTTSRESAIANASKFLPVETSSQLVERLRSAISTEADITIKPDMITGQLRRAIASLVTNNDGYFDNVDLTVDGNTFIFNSIFTIPGVGPININNAIIPIRDGQLQQIEQLPPQLSPGNEQVLPEVRRYFQTLHDRINAIIQDATPNQEWEVTNWSIDSTTNLPNIHLKKKERSPDKAAPTTETEGDTDRKPSVTKGSVI